MIVVNVDISIFTETQHLKLCKEHNVSYARNILTHVRHHLISICLY